MSAFARDHNLRAVIWAHLVVCPGLTANEIERGALRRRGGATISLCRRMEQDGQLISKNEYRAQQGRDVTIRQRKRDYMRDYMKRRRRERKTNLDPAG